MSNDNWKTPNWLMNVFKEFFDRTPLNADFDSLDMEWVKISFVNPPYSNPLPYILKGIEEHKKHGTTIVFLLKLDPSTKWFSALFVAKAHFLYFAERLHYSDQDSSPFPSVLAILSD